MVVPSQFDVWWSTVPSNHTRYRDVGRNAWYGFCVPTVCARYITAAFLKILSSFLTQTEIYEYGT